ncbi:MAG: hypothetical protein WCS27_16535 [Victivallaceae bacterium]
MKKREKIFLVLALLIAAGAALSFLIANSTLPSEINILWRHYFPVPPDEKYYQEKYSNEAMKLHNQGKYREAMEVLRAGLKEVNNRNLEADVIIVHLRIIQLHLKLKNIDMALKEMNYLMDLAANPKNIVVSKKTVTEIYSAITTACMDINNPELTRKFYKIILDYYKREFHNTLENLDSLFDLNPALHNLIYILERIKGSKEEMEIAQYVLKWSQRKNNEHDMVVSCVNDKLVELLCRKEEYSSAIKVLQNYLPTVKDQNENIKIRIKIVQVHIKAGNYSIATKKLEETLSTISKLRTYYEDEKGSYFQDIGNIYSDMGKYDLALKYLQKARRFFSYSTDFTSYVDDDIKKVKEKAAKKPSEKF